MILYACLLELINKSREDAGINSINQCLDQPDTHLCFAKFVKQLYVFGTASKQFSIKVFPTALLLLSVQVPPELLQWQLCRQVDVFCVYVVDDSNVLHKDASTVSTDHSH